MARLAVVMTTRLWFVLNIALLVDADVVCPGGWLASSESDTCIKLYNKNTAPWQDASVACHVEGGDLVKIVSLTMNDFIADQIAQIGGSDYWIGLHYDSGQDSFVWLDENSEASYTNWYSGQDIAADGCVVTAWNGYNLDEWGAWDCEQENTYICEANPDYIPELVCPTGWVVSADSGSCLLLVTDELPWDDARAFCQTQGGDLVKVVTSDMNVMIGDQIEYSGGYDYWIGLHYDSSQGYFVWLDEPTEPSYTTWYPGQEDSTDGCVTIAWNGYKLLDWGTWDCSQANKFVCESQPYTIPPPTCPDDWTASEESGTCVKTFTDPASSWNDARFACETLGADLVKIVNVDMNELLSIDVAKGGGSDYWIGLHYDSGRGYYVWLDETTEVTYTDWYPGDFEVDQGCVAMAYNGYSLTQWGPWDCSTNNNFICEALPTKLNTDTSSSDSDSGSDSDSDDNGGDITSPGGLSAGTIAGISFVCIVVVLALVGFFGFRFYKQRLVKKASDLKDVVDFINEVNVGNTDINMDEQPSGL